MVHNGGMGGTQRFTVPQMARHLNISERAVRKRIERGTLAARMVQGQYQITVVAEPEEQNGTQSVPIGRTTIGTMEPLSVQENVAASIIREAIAPFLDELKIAHQEIGHLRTLLDAEYERRQFLEVALEATKIHEKGKENYSSFPATDNAHRGTEKPSESSAKGLWSQLKKVFTGGW